MKKYFIPLFTLLLIKLPAQSIIVGFYNCENFYDTTNQIKVIDEEFLPTSQKSYTSKVYAIKSKGLAKVIFGMGKMDNSNGIAIMGLVRCINI